MKVARYVWKESSTDYFIFTFVDVVWLFLFVSIYWWGGIKAY